MESGIDAWLRQVPGITWALVGTVLLVLLIALAFSRRGGQFRRLPGWAGFWVAFAAVLILLAEGPRWLSFPLLAAVMYASLRDYFFVAPVRPRDRYVILAGYLIIPIALYPAYYQSVDVFLAVVPTSLVLFFPAFLSIGRKEKGMLDSAGRSLLGVVFFVFCMAHLALFVGTRPGLLELFGVLVLAAETPQRILGSFQPKRAPWATPALAVIIGFLLASAAGFLLGPWAGLIEEDGFRAGLFVAVAVTLGGGVSRAVARDLEVGQPRIRSRAAVLDHVVPAVYAAPVLFHYVNQFV